MQKIIKIQFKRQFNIFENNEREMENNGKYMMKINKTR